MYAPQMPVNYNSKQLYKATEVLEVQLRSPLVYWYMPPCSKDSQTGHQEMPLSRLQLPLFLPYSC